jgi:hypothetical protein
LKLRVDVIEFVGSISKFLAKIQVYNLIILADLSFWQISFLVVSRKPGEIVRAELANIFQQTLILARYS